MQHQLDRGTLGASAKNRRKLDEEDQLDLHLNIEPQDDTPPEPRFYSPHQTRNRVRSAADHGGRRG
jgi:hypothetical protein